MTVPASAALLTGKPAPSSAAAIARGLLAEPYPLAQVNTSRTRATQARLGVRVPVRFGTVVAALAGCIKAFAANGTLPPGGFGGPYRRACARPALSAGRNAAAS